MPNALFKMFAQIFGLVAIPVLIFFAWIDIAIFFDYKILLLIFLVTFFSIVYTLLHLHYIRNSKLSDLLTYENLDKLFTVVIWFFIFYWTVSWTSFTTLFIWILTIFIVTFFSIDIKNLRLPKTIWILILKTRLFSCK